MTYAELVQKIRDYTEVDSNVFTSTIVNGFILDAEWRIQRDVDSDNNRICNSDYYCRSTLCKYTCFNRSDFNY